MSRSRAKRSERCIDGLFILLPLSLVHHPDYYTLLPSALKKRLLSHLMYHGRATVKNADLSATFIQAQKNGVSTLK